MRSGGKILYQDHLKQFERSKQTQILYRYITSYSTRSLSLSLSRVLYWSDKISFKKQPVMTSIFLNIFLIFWVISSKSVIVLDSNYFFPQIFSAINLINILIFIHYMYHTQWRLSTLFCIICFYYITCNFYSCASLYVEKLLY